MLELNDKITTQIDQTPLKGGGASFTTRRLKEVSPSRYEFKPTFGAILFSLIFIILPLIIGYFFIQIFINHAFFFEITKNPIMILPMLVPFIFIIIGVAMLVSFSRPVVFDKSVGFFWKGFRQPSLVYNGNKRKKEVRLEEIQSLQILKEIVQGKNSFTSYELNLVLNNGERMNVADHGNLQKIKEDAQKLGQFLNVPVLDVVTN